MKPRHSSLHNHAMIIVVFAAVTAIGSTGALAADAVWNGGIDNLWATSGNWSAAIPGGSDNATFNNAGGANDTIGLGAGVTIGSLIFDTADADAYTIGGLGEFLTLGTSGEGISMSSTVDQNQTIAANLRLSTSGTYSVGLTNNSLTHSLFVTGGISASTGGIKILTAAGAGNTFVSGNLTNGSGGLGLTKSGTGILTLSGAASSINTALRVENGRVAVTGGSFATSASSIVGATANQTGVLTVAPGVTSSFSGGLVLGDAASASGAIYNSGTLNTTALSLAAFSNNASYGYVRNTGTLAVSDIIRLGLNNNATVFDIAGGSVTAVNRLEIGLGANSTSGLNITGGGTFTNTGGGGQAQVNSGGGGAYTSINIIGSGSRWTTGPSNNDNGIGLAQNGSANTLTLTLANGGALETAYTFNGNATPSVSINLDGGILRSVGANGGGIIQGSNTKTYIYSGGATFDTNGFNTIVSNLLTPIQTGNGLASIALPGGSPITGYIGAPVVKITGGGGVGAAAIAVFDPTTGAITGFTITSSGSGYTSTPTITLVGGQGGATGSAAATVSAGNITMTAGSVASGGLTKTGNAILTLGATNTYTGLTTVQAGDLRLGVNGALVAGNALTVNSNVASSMARFDLNGRNQTLGTVTLGGTGATATSTNQIVDVAGGGTLTLTGGVNYTATNNPLGATVSARLDLGSGTRTFDVANSSNATDDLTISSVIQNGGLTKSGAGQLRLNGANTYAGGTNLNAGTLVAGSTTAFGATASTLTISGGALDSSVANLVLANNNTQNWNGDFTFVGTNNLNLGTGAVTLNATSQVTVNAGNLIVGGNISGSGFGLTKAGAGRLTLSGTNSYTGATTINGGTLAVIGSTASGSAVAVNAGGTLSGTGVSGGSSTVAGPITVAGGTNSANQGTINLVNSSLETLNTGALTVGGGSGNFSQLNFDFRPAGTDLISTGSNIFTVNPGGANITMIVSGGVPAGGNYNLITFGSGAGSFATGSGVTVGALTLTNPSLTFGVTGALNVTSTAVQLAVTASAAPSTAYWLGTQATNGNLWTANNGTSGNFSTDKAGTSLVTALPGSTTDLYYAASGAQNLTNSALGQDFSVKSLTFDSTTAAASIAGNNILSIGTGGITLESGNGGATLGMTTLALSAAQTWNNASSNDLRVSANITGGGGANLAINNTSTGRTILTGTSSYTGSTTITAGTLQIGNGTTDGSISTSSNIVNTGSLVYNLVGTQTYGNAISGTGGTVTKNGGGTLTLGATNSYTGGTTLNAGTLNVGANGALGSGTLTLAGGTLRGTSNFGISNAISVTGATSVLGIAGDFNLNGNISGSGALDLAGTFNSSGLNLNGNNSGYTGTATISSSGNNSNVRVKNVNALSANAAWVVNGALQFSTGAAGTNTYHMGALSGSGVIDGHINNAATTNHIISVGAMNTNTTFSGTIINNATNTIASGNADGARNNVLALTKVGTGSLTLTGTNTYTGATNVTGGTLIVNGNISTSVLTTVGTGATLAGSGTVGTLTIDSGGFYSPGNSPGIGTVNGNYIQNGTLQVEVEGVTAGNGSGFHDQVVVNGVVTLNGLLSLTSFSGSYAMNNLIFILLNNDTDAISGNFTGLAQGASVGTHAGFEWQISYTGDSTSSSFTGGNDVVLMAIPEPGAALLGGLGLLVLLRRRRS